MVLTLPIYLPSNALFQIAEVFSLFVFLRVWFFYNIFHKSFGLSDDEFFRTSGLFKRDLQNGTEGFTLAAALLDQTVEYVVEGTFHAIEVDGASADFLLPLYITGTVPATLIDL